MANTDPRSAVQQRQDFEERNRPKYDPKVGDPVTIELPDERTRGTIVRVISPTRIIAQITQFTTGNKSHNYKKDDFVAAEHRMGMMNIRGWYVIPQAQLDAAPEPEPTEVEVTTEPPREMVEGDVLLPRKRRGS